MTDLTAAIHQAMEQAAMSGLYRPFAGAIAFEGADITSASSERVVEFGLVQVPEGRCVFPNMTVREDLELGGCRRGRKHRAQNLERVTEVFPRLEERFAQLAASLLENPDLKRSYLGV